MALKLLVRVQVRDIFKSRVNGLKMNETVLVTWNFNMLHLGHIRPFKFEKSFEMKLLVGITDKSIS